MTNTKRVSATAAGGSTKRVTAAASGGRTLRVNVFGNSSTTSYGCWGGSWGRTWGFTWGGGTSSVTANLQPDNTPRVNHVHQLLTFLSLEDGGGLLLEDSSGVLLLEGDMADEWSLTQRVLATAGQSITKRVP